MEGRGPGERWRELEVQEGTRGLCGKWRELEVQD